MRSYKVNLQVLQRILFLKESYKRSLIHPQITSKFPGFNAAVKKEYPAAPLVKAAPIIAQAPIVKSAPLIAAPPAPYVAAQPIAAPAPIIRASPFVATRSPYAIAAPFPPVAKIASPNLPALSAPIIYAANGYPF